MSNKTKLLISGLVALSLVFSFFAWQNSKKPVEAEKPMPIGAVAVPYLQVGAVTFWTAGLDTLSTGTSTVCALQAPAATSTLLTGGTRFKLASTSAVVVDVAKSSTRYATSTRIGTAYSIAASAQATIVASSTGSVAGDATIFEPSYWFIVKYTDNNNGTGNASTGSCRAVWMTF